MIDDRVNQLKIAHLIHCDGAGGGPLVASNLIASLNADFQQAAYGDGQGKMAQKCSSLGIPYVELPLTPLRRALRGYIRLERELRSFRPDMLILHGQWAGPLGAVAVRRLRIPHSVYIAHCPAYYHSTSLFRTIRNYIAEKLPCTTCDRVVTLSDGNFYNYLYRGWAPEQNLILIHNGVDPNCVPSAAFVQKLRVTKGFESASRHAVFVGRIDDQKRVDWLLEAWTEALARTADSPHRKWHLWIVGDGKERSYCEGLAALLGIKDSVHFVGQQKDALTWIAAGDLLIMTSLYEGHALVPLEAMACAKPVVAFTVDGITDSVADNETGLLCDLGDCAKLGANIAELLTDDARRQQLGANGRLRLKEKFTLEASMEAYRGLIAKILGHEKNQAPHLAAH